MTATLSTNGNALRDTFRAWNAERDVLDAQLSESLSALAAYQSHLDEWQQQLARDREELRASKEHFERERNELHATKDQLESDWSELRGARGKIEQERDELRGARSQLERDRAATDKGQFEASATLTAELNAARDKISAITTSLLSRTEELRTLDNRRSEVVTELELARAREKELKATLDEHKRTAELERVHWTEELRHLRELLERRVETNTVEEPAVAEAAAPVATPQLTGGGEQVIPRGNPVFGSIVEQFDKLRQQRAFDRQSVSKSR